MKMSRCFRQMTVWILIGLVAAGTAAGQDKALKVLPDNSLLCLKLNGLEPTLNKLDSFLLGVSPFLPGMMVKGQLMALLGNPTFAGLDQQGSIVLFVVPATDPSGPIPVMPGLLVPVTDYKVFISGSQACQDMGDGTAMMSVEDLPPLQIVQAGDFALMAPAGIVDIAALKQQLRFQGGRSLGQALSKAAGQEASGHSLWVYANLQQVNSMFGPMIQMGAMAAKQELQGMAGEPGMAQVLSMMDAMLSLLDQLGTATLSLNIKSTALNLTGSFSGVSGSPLAQALDMSVSGRCLDQMMGQMDPSHMISMAGAFDAEKLARLMQLWMGDMIDPGFWEKYKAVGSVCAVQHFDVGKDTNGNPCMVMTNLSQLENPQPVMDLFANPEAVMEAFGLKEMMADSGLGVSVESSKPQKLFTHQGVDVQAVTQKITFDDANDPDLQMAATMVSEETSLLWAVMGKTLVSAVGPGCDDQIKGLIDKAKKGLTGSASAELKTLLGYLGESKDVDIVATYNYAKIISLVAATMPIPVPQMEIPIKTPLVLAAKSRKGTIFGELAVPKPHLQEVMQFVQMMMMQQMQSQP